MTPPPPELRFENTVIDFTGRRLLRNGVVQTLEPKAFNVLTLLATQPGRVVSRDEILNTVWGHEHLSSSALNRVMSLLRHALGEDAQRPRLLHTVHGVGFRFDLPKPAEATSATASPQRLRKLHWLAVPVALALLAALGRQLWPQPATPPLADEITVVQSSVAVLPLTSAGDDDFFSTGIAESLIATLSQYDGLKVIGRSSSFQFQGGTLDSKAIGEKLGVTHLISGSVQRADGRVRIGMELVSASDGKVMWAQRFDRPMQDLFALQDEIALAVTAALQVNLLHTLPGAVETGRPASGNLEAYTAFLHGAFYINKDSQQAIKHFTEATRLDPGYAAAWQWMGSERVHYAQMLTGTERATACTQARKEIETAIGLAPDYGLGYTTLGNQLKNCDWNWNGALAAFEKGMPLVTDNSPAHGNYSTLLRSLGKLNQAVEEQRKNIAGNPLSRHTWNALADLQTSLGELDDAQASLAKSMQVQPDNTSMAVTLQMHLALLRGDAQAALEIAQRTQPEGFWRNRNIMLALQIGNDRAAADAALRDKIEHQMPYGNDPLDIALAYALRSDADKVFEWLDHAWQRRAPGVQLVLSDPILLRYRNDARFADYCRKTGLPPPSQSQALSIDQIRAMLPVKH
jgi:TolB-like protein/DNA-binding winged helix-turn-helix (wHTH) protein/Tfp pilus assembly protein PilF